MNSKENLISDIGEMLVNSSPIPNWEKVSFRYHQVANWAQGFIFYFEKSGEKHWASSEDVVSYAHRLRKLMAYEQTEKGTWFSMQMEVRSNGQFTLQFDYNEKPDFGFEILDETYITDFQKYPRHSNYIPEWLKNILNQNNVQYESE